MNDQDPIENILRMCGVTPEKDSSGLRRAVAEIILKMVHEREDGLADEAARAAMDSRDQAERIRSLLAQAEQMKMLLQSVVSGFQAESNGRFFDKKKWLEQSKSVLGG